MDLDLLFLSSDRSPIGQTYSSTASFCLLPPLTWNSLPVSELRIPVWYNLTPSLPSCHLKTTIKSAKSETLKPFWLLSALACERTFIKMYCIESRRIIGPENILFAGVSVGLSAWKFYRLGQWRGYVGAPPSFLLDDFRYYSKVW